MDSQSFRRQWMAALSLFAFAGCATFQDAHYEYSQKWRTECAWLEYWWCNPEWTGSDYKKGWQAGYLDVLTGGSGEPPMIAPHEYWKPSQILKDCDKGRHDWYVGFQDGAMMATNLPDTHYIKLWNPPPVGHVGLAPAMVQPMDAGYIQSLPVTEPKLVDPKLAPPGVPPANLQPIPELNSPPVDQALPPNPASYEMPQQQAQPAAFPTF